MQTGTHPQFAIYIFRVRFIFYIMNEQLEGLFSKHFNGLHYEDITKEMMFKFAIDYANIKVEAEKQTIREYLEGEGYELLAEGV